MFLGHGRDAAWRRVQEHLKGLLTSEADVEAFETRERPGLLAIPHLMGLLEKSEFAVLVFTAEDETKDDTMRARQNVIYEAGLFHGRLGLERVALLVDDRVQLPSNLHGLLRLPFVDGKIESTFLGLDKALRDAGLVS